MGTYRVANRAANPKGGGGTRGTVGDAGRRERATKRLSDAEGGTSSGLPCGSHDGPFHWDSLDPLQPGA